MSPTIHCNSCMVEIATERQLECSACKSRVYCSKDCQRIDWKRSGHKLQCPILANQRETQGKFLLRLLLQCWLKNSDVHDMIRWIIVKALTKEQMLQSPSQYYVTFDVVFDYNWKTFVPKLPPTVTRKELVDRSGATTGREEYSQTVLVIFCGVMRGLSITFDKTVIDQFVQSNTWFAGIDASWDYVRDSVRVMCSLSSPVFEPLRQLQDDNINKQLGLICASNPFGSFLICALHALPHVSSIKPRCLTHIVVIQFDLGLGLGQITRLVGYTVMTVEDLLDDMQNSQCYTPERIEYFRNYFNPPSQRAMQSEHTLRVFFSSRNVAKKYSHAFIFDRKLPQLSPSELLPQCFTYEMDHRARLEFEKVQALDLPSVESPALN